MSRLSILEDNVVVLTAASRLTEDANGKTFILNSGTEFLTVLPPLRAGLKLSFIVGAAPSGANYTIEPANGADIIHGLSLSADGGVNDSTAGTAVDLVSFVGAAAVVGDRVDFVCDGTYWHAVGYAAVGTGITWS